MHESVESPSPLGWLAELPAYTAGVHSVGTAEPIVLSANENNLGASPAVAHALQQAIADIHCYPEAEMEARITDALSARLGIRLAEKREGIMLGNGSDELISLLCRCYIDPGAQHAIVMHSYGFSMYDLCARAQRGNVIRVPGTGLAHDIDAIIAAAQHPNVRIVFLATPNNPTGELLSDAAIQRLLREIPRRVLLVCDAAYAEFSPAAAAIHQAVAEHAHVVVLRTFSKAYAMAGLRLGYVHASSAVIDVLRRVRSVFSVNRLALVAGLAALSDPDTLAEHTKTIGGLRDHWQQLLRSAGAEVAYSEGNFLMVVLPSAQQATRVIEVAATHGIILRPLANYGLPRAVRITIGTPEQMVFVEQHLLPTIAEACANSQIPTR